MRRRLMLSVIGLTLATWIAPALADPFNGTPVVPADAGNLSLMPGGVIAHLAHIQMQLNDVISRQFQSVHKTGSIIAFVAILALAFLYGVVHAGRAGTRQDRGRLLFRRQSGAVAQRPVHGRRDIDP